MATAILSISEQVTPEEWDVRQNLAALYRTVAMHGWDDSIFTHMTARVPGPDEHFLINPFGVLFDSVTASNLVKLDLEGKTVIDTAHPINPAGYNIHSAVHEVRPDAQCVIHLHTRAGAAVAAQQQGLLPISQQATAILGSIAYHDYEGIALNPDEKVRLQHDLGDKRTLILRNHGYLVCGPEYRGRMANHLHTRECLPNPNCRRIRRQGPNHVERGHHRNQRCRGHEQYDGPVGTTRVACARGEIGSGGPILPGVVSHSRAN